MKLITDNKVFFDPCLKCESWLEVIVNESVSEEEVLERFTEFVEQIRSVCDEKRLKQASVRIPMEWMETQQLFEKSGWGKSLRTLQLDLFTTDINFKLNDATIQILPPFEEIRPLLEEQAIYHSDHYPRYYKAPDEIDWLEYRSVVEIHTLPITPLNCVYINSGKPAGVIVGELDGNSAHMYEFVVSEKYRGAGIGKALIESMINLARKNGAISLISETWWDQPAKNLYLRHGFKETKQEYFLQL